MPPIPYANVTDPLSLGSLYECISENSGGSEVSMKDINKSTGGFLQGDARVRNYPLETKYYLQSGATLLLAGSTVNGYFIDSCVPGKSNDGHDEMTVRAHKRVNATITDTVVTGP